MLRASRSSASKPRRVKKLVCERGGREEEEGYDLMYITPDCKYPE